MPTFPVLATVLRSETDATPVMRWLAAIMTEGVGQAKIRSVPETGIVLIKPADVLTRIKLEMPALPVLVPPDDATADCVIA
jgi:hypothetical protein